MGPKKDNDSKVTRKMTRITIEVKKEIIAKHENGVRVSDLATQFGVAKSTISTILKNKETIKGASVEREVTVVIKQRSQTIEVVERLLLIWINEKMLAGDSVSEGIICEKARQLHKNPGTSADTDVFQASRGWFEKFKKRSGIHSVVRHREAASANQKAAEEFVQNFSDYVKAEGFLPQQVFNCDETGLFWKKNAKEDIHHARRESGDGN
jgi:transposase-like protein